MEGEGMKGGSGAGRKGREGERGREKQCGVGVGVGGGVVGVGGGDAWIGLTTVATRLFRVPYKRCVYPALDTSQTLRGVWGGGGGV